MGHGTSSERTSNERPRRSLADALGITPERLIERSQLAIQSLNPSGFNIRDITVGNPERNVLYTVTMFKELEGRGYRARVYDNQNQREELPYEHFDNLNAAKNAIYEKTGIPKPKRTRR